ncbi:MAG: 50S ribosomal protein L19e [Nanoarchaeota archaeon]|nr:50S ribosomal protein L19e [Nanoarchaeota archaeon]
MNLRNKKELAAKTLGVGKNRIKFNPESLSEIKEAITKEDIRSLHSEGLIIIKPIKGRKRIKRRKIKRGPGKIKIKVKKRKENYVKVTRKLRRYIKDLRLKGKIDKENYLDIRKKIKMKYFKSKSSLKEYLDNVGIGNKIENKKQTKTKRRKQK